MNLTSAQRDEAQAESNRIAAMFSCMEPPIVRAAVIGRIMAGSPTGAADKNASRARTDNYRDATDDIPVWAIAAAVKRWNRGEVTAGEVGGRSPNFEFAPAPPILRMICLGVMKPYRDALHQIDKLLTAKPLSEILTENNEKSEKVVKGFEKLSETLSQVPDIHRRPPTPPIDVDAIRAQGNACAEPKAEQIDADIG